MSEAEGLNRKTSEEQVAVKQRFNRFVAEHAAEASLWVFTQQTGQLSLQHIEFETHDKPWLPERPGWVEEGYSLDAYGTSSMTAGLLQGGHGSSFYVEGSVGPNLNFLMIMGCGPLINQPESMGY